MGQIQLQEIMNAATMMVPVRCMSLEMLASRYAETRWHCRSMLFMLALWFHCVCSVVYHVRCAFKCDRHHLDNVSRRLDQSAIHGVCVIWAFCLSGSFVYGGLVFLISAWCIIQLWQPGPASWGVMVRARLTTATVLYLLPMAFRKGQLANFAYAMVLISVAFLRFAFSKRWLHGYGHALFHLILAPFGLILIRSLHDLGTSRIVH